MNDLSNMQDVDNLTNLESNIIVFADDTVIETSARAEEVVLKHKTQLQKFCEHTLQTRKTSYILLILVIITSFYSYQSNHILLLASGGSAALKSLVSNHIIPKQPPFEAKIVQKVTNSIFSSLSNNPLRLKCSNCAVIFSSGHLINSSSGPKIDSADCVVRFNDAPTGGIYAKDVGNKTTLRFVDFAGAETIVSGKSNHNYSVIRNEKIVLFSFRRKSMELVKIFPENEFYAAFKNAFLTVVKQEVKKGSLSGRRKSPKLSSGFSGVAVMLSFCPSITVYGASTPKFCEKNPNSKVPYHYYMHVADQGSIGSKTECDFYTSTMRGELNRKNDETVHLFSIEHEIYRKWRSLHNITFRAPQWD
ncbi:alpha-N-acetylgalactosaminide alpha-2,6-sialyltransferase 5-like [Convolutriloba macropyga]|uniref:alpha-N-acetylgalactosaminide alpha-2,6-sialyltransferase 5-like n=1 Tax=Convolutriloba macropyga TaxID=536237 RepID=UPI003F51B604